MKSILLVEDDQFVIDIYTRKLKEAGFSVEIAEDGEEALKKIRTKKPDLLILDIVLPNIDGWEILNKIKKDPEIEDLKIVVLTNLSQKSDLEKGLSLGIVKYFIKAHFTPSEIIKEVKKILK